MDKQHKTGLARNLTHYGDPDFSIFLRKSFASSMGYSREMLDHKIIGIAYTGSGFNNCHRHFPEMLEAVKRGIIANGALPMEFPTISLGEVYLNPTSLKFRNLMALDTEVMIKAQPMDAVILMGGCDKTIPAQLMGAISANIPSIQLVGGPMMTSKFEGERLGACTDCRRFWTKFRAGAVSENQIHDVESRLATTSGTCPIMGTASTMACVAESLGLALPGSATIPAVNSDRLRAAELTGKTAVEIASNPILPKDLITMRSVENALRTILALGGSTNAIIHLTAIAGRAGINVSLYRFNELSDTTPVLVNLKPIGNHYMEDLYFAGGLGAVLRELKPLLHLDCPTVTGETLGERLDYKCDYVDRSVIASRNKPFDAKGGLISLFGNLAPKGAILKRSAATKELFETVGRAVVFESLEDLSNRIDHPDLDVFPEDFLILKNAGPASPSGMPEAGYLPIPKKMLAQGVEDMVRISDARMSGSAFGTVILHVTPESAVGGPLSLVANGDMIKLSVSEKKLDLLVSPEELEARREKLDLIPASVDPLRGYEKLYNEQILQADKGCDFEFLLPLK